MSDCGSQRRLDPAKAVCVPESGAAIHIELYAVELCAVERDVVAISASAPNSRHHRSHISAETSVERRRAKGDVCALRLYPLRPKCTDRAGAKRAATDRNIVAKIT